MKTQSFVTMIPLEIGDIVKIKEYANTYKLTDILLVHSVKNNKSAHILQLSEYVNGVDYQSEIRLPYEDFNWEIVKVDSEEE